MGKNVTQPQILILAHKKMNTYFTKSSTYVIGSSLVVVFAEWVRIPPEQKEYIS
jgi:hypothetical protein